MVKMTKKQALDRFLSSVAREEAGRTQARIGDIRQIARIMNKNLGGLLYAAIHALENAKK